MTFLRTGLFIGLLVSGLLHAVDFNQEIRPLLANKCYTCHGPDKESREAKLRLDIREEALKDELETTCQNEQTILSGITEKYGPGTLDPATGVFTPTEDTE